MANNGGNNATAQLESEDLKGGSFSVGHKLIDAADYKVWSSLMLPTLEYHKLATTAVGTNNSLSVTFKDDDPKTRLFFLRNLSVDRLRDVSHLSKPSEIWNYFHNAYAGESFIRMFHGVLDLIKWDPNSTSTMLEKLSALTQKVRATEEAANSKTVSIEQLGLIMFQSKLPTIYASSISHLSRSNVLTIQEAKPELMRQESLLHASDTTELTAMVSNKRAKTRRGITWPKGTIMCKEHKWEAKSCYNCHPELKGLCKDCGERGHYSLNSARCSKNSKNSSTDGKVGGAAVRFVTDDDDEILPFGGRKFGGAAHLNIGEDQVPKGEPTVSERLGPHPNRPLSDRLGPVSQMGSLKKRKGPMVNKTGFKTRVSKKTKSRLNSRSSRSNDLAIVFDSGANVGIFNNKSILKNYSSISSQIGTAGEGQNINCVGKGTLTLNGNITLHDIYHCPNAAMNLLSVSQLTDLGLTVLFDSVKCTVARNGEAVLIGTRLNGLYVYKPTSHGLAFLAANKLKTRMDLFHARMGHINYADLRRLSHMSYGIILDDQPETEICKSCVMAKSHRKHFNSSDSHAKHFGELTYFDICYIGVEAVNGGFNQFILFTDDYSRFMKCYLIKHKSDALSCIKQYDTVVLNQTGKHCQYLRSDNAKEFTSNAVKEYCNTHGIIQQTSNNYSPQSMGRAERPNRTCVEGTSAMLHFMGQPHNLWSYALLCFVYLKNRSPHTALCKRTPYEARFQKLPNLSNIRIWGCKAYMHIPKEKRTGAGSKLVDKARELIFVGYSERSGSWLLFDPATHEEHRSDEVLFDEQYSSVTRTQIRLIEHMQLSDQSNPQNEDTTEVNQSGDSNDTQRGEPSSSNEPPSSSNEQPSSSNEQILSSIDEDHEIGREAETFTTADLGVNSGTNQQVGNDDLDPLLMVTTYNPITALAIAEATEHESENSFDNMLHALIAKTVEDIDNPSYEQAMAGPYREQFIEGIAKEFKALMDNEVFSEPMDLPKGFKPLDTKLVLKLKEAEFKDAVRIAKARLCARGFNQIYGRDFFETYAPVASFDTLRIFLTLMASMDYEIDCVDVITAFLLAILSEEIYIEIPDGYPNKHLFPGKVLRLLKTLYGLKQAPMEWNATADAGLKPLGFKPTQSDKCIYVGEFNGEICYLLIYVDDILIATRTRETMQLLKSTINKIFPIKDKGPVTFFLNMHVHRDRKNRTITLHQQPKIEKLLTDPRLTSEEKKFVSKVNKVPASPDLILSHDQCPKDGNDPNACDRTIFQSFVGMLLYITVTARPDLATAVSSVARFSHNPGQIHWRAVLMILRYLQGTIRMRIQLGGKPKYPELRAYVDSDWAGDKTRKSRTGFVIFLNGSPVIWSSKLQKCVALSSTEAEYVAVTAAARYVIWTRQLLEELGFEQQAATSVCEDNKGCIDIAVSSKAHPAVKHIDIRHHFIRERVQEIKDIKLEKVGTDVMVADLFTKQLVFPVFKRHRDSLQLTQH